MDILIYISNDEIRLIFTILYIYYYIMLKMYELHSTLSINKYKVNINK